MSRWKQREAACVDNTQSSHAEDTSSRVNHSIHVIFLAHGARPCGVVDRGCRLHDHFQNVLVRGDVAAREELGAPVDDPADGVRGEDLARASESGDCDFLVAGVEKPIWTDDGVFARVVGCDCHVAPGEGRDDAG